MPKRSKTTTSREIRHSAEPDWARLEAAAVKWLCGQFMAMEEADLKNGAHVCCFKHIETRRSLHLTADGEAYLYSFDPRRPGTSGRYERVSLDEAFSRVVLLPEFEHGWLTGDRSARGPVLDDEGNEVEDERDYTVSDISRWLAERDWLAHIGGRWPEVT